MLSTPGTMVGNGGAVGGGNGAAIGVAAVGDLSKLQPMTKQPAATMSTTRACIWRSSYSRAKKGQTPKFAPARDDQGQVIERSGNAAAAESRALTATRNPPASSRPGSAAA